MRGIYKIRNTVNQKVYIGSTVDPRVRFQTHRRQLRGGRHHCKHLQAAWNKYGEDCFKFEVVEVVAEDAQLVEAENRWLAEAIASGNAYNSAPSAGTTWLGASGEAHPAYGSKRSEETKARMSASIKAWAANNPDKVAKGEKHYRYGKALSADVRKKIGDTQRGVKKGPRTMSEESRVRILAAAAAGRYSHSKGRKRPKEEFVNLVRGCREITTGAEFFSLNDALRHFGLKMPTLRRALVTGKPLSKGPLAGLRFEYLTSPQTPVMLQAPNHHIL